MEKVYKPGSVQARISNAKRTEASYPASGVPLEYQVPGLLLQYLGLKGFII